MTKITMDEDAKLRLWQCYRLLVELVEEKADSDEDPPQEPASPSAPSSAEPALTQKGA